MINIKHWFPRSYIFNTPELGTLEWWISGLMLNPLFLLIKYLDQQIGF